MLQRASPGGMKAPELAQHVTDMCLSADLLMAHRPKVISYIASKPESALRDVERDADPRESATREHYPPGAGHPMCATPLSACSNTGAVGRSRGVPQCEG